MGGSGVARKQAAQELRVEEKRALPQWPQFGKRKFRTEAVVEAPVHVLSGRDPLQSGEMPCGALKHLQRLLFWFHAVVQLHEQRIDGGIMRLDPLQRTAVLLGRIEPDTRRDERRQHCQHAMIPFDTAPQHILLAMPLHPTVPYQPPPASGSPIDAAQAVLDRLRTRRSVRHFSDRPVPRDLIERVVAAAGTAPSGANKQPWRFVAVSDPVLKQRIREGAEAEERAFYNHRASADWLRDLEPLGTDAEKPFLEQAPWLIVVFKLMEDDIAQNDSRRVYYVNESVGIATGILLAAAAHAGLATLTHTPSPMAFLGDILGRPHYERPFLLIPVGWAADDCQVPDISRKELDQILVFQ